MEKSVAQDNSSLKALVLLALPLTIVTGHASLAIFLQRVILARFSPEAHDAVCYGHAFVYTFQMFVISLASVVQVFVGQASSSGKKTEVGVYVWQMIWLVILTSAVISGVSWAVSPWLFNELSLQQEACNYFNILIGANVVFGLSTVLISFYVGRKKIIYAVVCSLLAIAVHFGLSFTLITGYSGLIPSMGVVGAAWAEVMTQVFLCLLLVVPFLHEENRRAYSTFKWPIEWKPFLKVARVGIPNGMIYLLFLSTWAFTLHFVQKKGDFYLRVAGLGNTFSYFEYFVALGIGNAATIMASHAIGREEWNELGNLIRSFSIFTGIFLLIVLPILMIFPETILSFFYSDYPLGYTSEEQAILIISCWVMWFHAFVTIFERLLRSILTAAGDTFFMFMIYLVAFSIVFSVAICVALVYFDMSSRYFWAFATIAMFMRSLFLVYRLGNQKWRSSANLLVAREVNT